MQRTLITLWMLLSFIPLQAQGTLKEIRSTVKEIIGGKEYYIHTVKRGQSLYMISKAYDTDVNTIILENPQVKEGLKSGQKLKIPVPGSGQKATGTTPPAVEENIEKPPLPEVEKALPCEPVKTGNRTIYKVALMIPLYLGEVSSIETDNNASDDENEYRSLRFIQFYEGFMMALDSLEMTGLSLKLYVYDVNRDTLKTKALLKKDELKEMDLIIGLVYSRNFQLLSEFARDHHIPLVNPVSEREQIIRDNPMVFKVRPGLESQPEHLTEYLVTHYTGANIIVVANEHDSYTDASVALQKSCEAMNIQVGVAASYGEIKKLLSKEKENVIIVYAGERVYALDLITKLNELRMDYKLTLVGLPQWDRLDEELEAEYLVNLRTHILASWFIDYEDPDTKKFEKAFQQKYFADPDHLAFQGFDVAFYFISALQKFGGNLDHCIPEFRMKSLQTDFQFKSSGNDGFENQHWVIYSYGDYRKLREN